MSLFIIVGNYCSWYNLHGIHTHRWETSSCTLTKRWRQKTKSSRGILTYIKPKTDPEMTDRKSYIFFSSKNAKSNYVPFKKKSFYFLKEWTTLVLWYRKPYAFLYYWKEENPNHVIYRQSSSHPYYWFLCIVFSIESNLTQVCMGSSKK